jgi:AraC-like DNA-binding protein
MDGPPSDFRLLRFSSDRYPHAERRDAWQAILARKLLALEVEPLSETPFSVHASLRLLHGLRFGTGIFSASINRRTKKTVEGDNDDFAIVINLEDTMTAEQRGRHIMLNPGSAYLLACSEEGVYAKRARGRVMLARFPHKAIAPLAPLLYDKVARAIPSTTESLRLLSTYFRVLEDNQALATADLRGLVVRHVYDLIALVLNPSRDQAAASAGGVQAARLNAIKTYVTDNLARHSLSVADAAAAQHLSLRQVQRLFESEGMTFSEFLQVERLKHVKDELTDPQSRRSISEIAYDAGFGDVSHFNRAFRRRYGASPSEVRRGETGTPRAQAAE